MAIIRPSSGDQEAGSLMLSLFRFLFVRAAVPIQVPRTPAEMAAELTRQLAGPAPETAFVDRLFDGTVTDAGFRLCYVGPRAESGTSHAIRIAGRFEPAEGGTRIVLTLRHGWHLLLFSGLMLVIATLALMLGLEPSSRGRTPSNLYVFILALLGISVWWHYRLRSELKRVQSAVSEMLRTLCDSSPQRLTPPTGAAALPLAAGTTAPSSAMPPAAGPYPDPPPSAVPLGEITVTGLKPPLSDIVSRVASGIVLALIVLPMLVSAGSTAVPFGVLLVFSVLGVVASIRARKQPPDATVAGGLISLRLSPSQIFTTPADNVADIDLRGGRLTVTFRSVQAVQPVKQQQFLETLFQKQGYHLTAGQGTFSLEQVNQLRTALGRPPLLADLFGEFEALLDRLTPRVRVMPTLIAVNVLVFAGLAVSSSSLLHIPAPTMLAWGANYGPKTTQGEWWRLISSVFLHFGVMHLMFNMLALRGVGRTVERLLGGTGFAIGYLASGFCGSLASAAWHDDVISAGASGAVFGVFGMLLAFVAGRHAVFPAELLKAHRASVTMFLILNLFLGSQIPGIDQAAHAGGFVGGMLCGLILRCDLAVAASQRPIRNLVLASLAGLLGTVGVASLPQRAPGLDMIAANVDKVDTAAVAVYRQLLTETQSGKLTGAEAARKVTETIVPQYAELSTQLRGVRRSTRAEQEQVREALREYLELRKEGWELIGQSMATNDIVSEGQALLHFESARAVAAKINPAANATRPASPADVRTEITVLSVGEQQALQAYARARNQFASEELTEVQFAEVLEREVLPVWQSARQRFTRAATQFPPDQQAMGQRMVSYLELQAAGWQLQIDGLREKDQSKFEEGERQLDAAKSAAEAVWQPATSSEK